MSEKTTESFAHSKSLVSLILLSLGALLFGFILASPPPDILSSIEAETEYLSFTVFDPDRAALYVPEARITAPGWEDGSTVSGLFVPAMGSTVTYRRNTKDSLTIEVDAPGQEADSIAGTLELAEKATSRLGSEVEALKDRVGFQIAVTTLASPSLPIWGNMVLGREFAPPALPRPPEARLLRRGKLTVSGVSGGSHGSVLYPITAIDLPLGARVETAPLPNGSPGPAWWGMVTLMTDQPVLNVSAVSESRRIALYLPGKQDADQVEVWKTDKLTHDPRVISLQLYIVGIVAFASGLAGLGEPLRDLGLAMANWGRSARRRWFGASVLLAGLLAGVPANAQIVRLIVGDNTFGQGWLFWDTDALCKVVTARHVITSNNDQLLSPRVIDSRDVEHEMGPAIVDSPAYDIVVLPVVVGNPAQVCNNGRLSTIGVERRLRMASRLMVDTTGRTDIRHVAASLTAANRDDAGGENFLIRLDGSTEAASEGWSGSIVLDAEGPLGIVQRLAPDSQRDLIALRIDVVRRLLNGAPSPVIPANINAKPIIDLTSGSTAVLAEGQGRSEQLLAGTGLWCIRPTKGQIRLSVTLPTSLSFHGATVTLAPDTGASVQGVGLDTIADLNRPDAIGESVYMRGTGGQGAYTLRVSPRTVRQLRLVVGAASERIVCLAGFNMF